MAFISNEQIEEFRKLATEWLADKGLTPEQIETGSNAWSVAVRSGITDICYGNSAKDEPGIPGCVDAHIKTALTKIFPNAIFKDKYQY